jgi:hypothetical protein
MSELISMHQCIGERVFGTKLGQIQKRRLWEVLRPNSRKYKELTNPYFDTTTKTFRAVAYASAHIESKDNGCAAIYWVQYCTPNGQRMLGPRWVVDVRTKELEAESNKRVDVDMEKWLSENLHLFPEYNNVPYKQLIA